LPKSISTIYFLYKRLVIPQEKQYDLVINVDKNSSSGRLSTKFAKSDYKYFGDEETDLNQNTQTTNTGEISSVYVWSHLSKLGIPNKENWCHP
jgi:hypothetical protein